MPKSSQAVFLKIRCILCAALQTSILKRIVRLGQIPTLPAFQWGQVVCAIPVNVRRSNTVAHAVKKPHLSYGSSTFYVRHNPTDNGTDMFFVFPMTCRVLQYHYSCDEALLGRSTHGSSLCFFTISLAFRFRPCSYISSDLSG